MKTDLRPKKAKALPGAKDAWYYENKGSIDVFIQRDAGGVVAARINRCQLLQWIKRTERPHG